MSLILDHVNGIADDNRLENLRIVCPNCAATLETHCGRNKRRRCGGCGETFQPKSYAQRFCATSCHKRTLRGVPRRRTVLRPSYEQLLAEIQATSYCAVGRKYGVSDNAIRKWVRQYRRERARRACRAGRMTRRVTALRLR